MESKFSFKKNFLEGTTRIRLQFVQKLFRGAECKTLQALRLDLLHLIKKILKSAFVTSGLQSVILRGFTTL